MGSARRIVIFFFALLYGFQIVSPAFAAISGEIIASDMTINGSTTLSASSSGTLVYLNLQLIMNPPSGQEYHVSLSGLPSSMTASGFIIDSSTNCPNLNSGSISLSNNSFSYTFSGAGVSCNAVVAAEYVTSGVAVGSYPLSYTITNGGADNSLATSGDNQTIASNGQVTMTVTNDVRMISATTRDTDGNGLIDAYDFTFNNSFDRSLFDVNQLTIGGKTNASGSFVNISSGTGNTVRVTFAEDPTWDTGTSPYSPPDVLFTGYASGSTVFQSIGSTDITETDGARPELLTLNGTSLLSSTGVILDPGVNVAGNAGLVFKFSETMDPTTTVSDFSLLDSSGANLTGSASVSTNTLTFVPLSHLVNGIYSAMFAGSAKDFSTLNTLPARTVAISVTTNDQMDPYGGLITGMSGATNTGILIDNGSQYTNNAFGYVTLTLSGADNVLVAQMCVTSSGSVAKDSLCPDGTWETYVTTKNNYPLGGVEGIKTVYVKFKDTSGNISPVYSDSIIWDKTPPKTIASPTGGLFAAPQNITLTSESGASVFYATGGMSPTDTNGVPGANTVKITSGDTILTFSGTLEFYSLDLADNKETPIQTQTYIVDSDVPTITYSVDKQYIGPTGAVTITWSGSKASTLTGGPEDAYDIRIGGGGIFGSGTAATINSSGTNYVSDMVESTTIDANALSEGTNTIYVFVTDGTYTGSTSFQIHKDTIAPSNPSIGIDGGSTATDTTRALLTLSATDSSPISSMMLGGDITDASAGTWIPYASSTSVHLSSRDGTKNITVQYEDAAGNISSIATGSILLDTVGPTITLNGSSSETAEFATSYTELGATWSDAVDGTGVITVPGSGSVDLNTLGDYTLVYSHTDTAGNTGSASRTVHVTDTTPPTVTLNGSGTINLERGTSYTELGATWSDPGYGTGVVSTISGAVDTSTLGTYILSYLETDPSGNTGSASRTIVITDTIAPVISNLTSTGMTSSGGSFSFDADESGTGYYVVVLSGTTVPSAAQVLGRVDGNNNPAIKSGSFITASGSNTFIVSGLSSNTDYEVYVVDKDLIGNLQTSVLSSELMTLVATDSTPDAFTFTPTTNAERSTNYTSATIISGTDTGSIISVTGGEYSVGTGSYTSVTGIVNKGDVITAIGTSSDSYSTATHVVITIGGVSGTYTITTRSTPLLGWGGGGGGSYALLAKDICPNGDFSASFYDGSCGITSTSATGAITSSGVVTTIPGLQISTSLPPLLAKYVDRYEDVTRHIGIFRTKDPAIANRMIYIETQVLNRFNNLIGLERITPVQYAQAIAGYNKFVVYLTVYRQTGIELAKTRALDGIRIFMEIYRK